MMEENKDTKAYDLDRNDRRIFRVIQSILTAQNADALKDERKATRFMNSETKDERYARTQSRTESRALTALRDIRELILREAQIIDIVLTSDPEEPHERFVEIERNGRSIRLGWDIIRDVNDELPGRTIRFLAVLPQAPDALPINEEES